MQSIDSITVGTVLATWTGELKPEFARQSVDPKSWRIVTLQSNTENGQNVTIRLLRPINWLITLGIEAGRMIELALPEAGLNGSYLVSNIESCPSSVSGQLVGMVTGTYATDCSNTVGVYLLGSNAKPIRVTPGHLFYSSDRGQWIEAAQLDACERIQSNTGEAVVDHVAWDDTCQYVYNLELAATETYYVGNECILVHNACAHGQFVKDLRRRGFSTPVPTNSGGGKMYTHPNGTRVRIMPRPNRQPHPGEPPEKL